MPGMQRKLVRALDELAARKGLRPDAVLDWDLLSALEEACREELSPGASVHDAWVDEPLAAGGALFRRLSWHASTWLDRAAARYDGKPTWLLVLHGWTMAHGRDRDLLARCEDPRELDRALRAWAHRLDCSLARLAQVVDRLAPAERLEGTRRGKAAAGSADGPQAIGEVVADLLQRFGQTPAWWLYEAPLEVLNDACRQLCEAQHDEHDRAIKLAGGAGAGANPFSRKVQAHMRFSRVMRDLVDRLEGRAA